MRPYLDEIVNRAGSQRKAAKELGISRTQLRIWCQTQYRYRNGERGCHARYVTRDSAALIIRTLRRLRQDGVFYDHRGKPGPKPLWVKADDAEAQRKRLERLS